MCRTEVFATQIGEHLWAFKPLRFLARQRCRRPDRVPPLKKRPQRTIERSRPGLQQQMCAARGPLHLLTLREAFTDYRIYRGLGQA